MLYSGRWVVSIILVVRNIEWSRRFEVEVVYSLVEEGDNPENDAPHVRAGPRFLILAADGGTLGGVGDSRGNQTGNEHCLDKPE
jgi:hypothetical protein